MIEVREIDLNNKKQKKAFVDLDYAIYGDDPNWVAPLRMDINQRLNPQKHPFYHNGNIKCYIAYRNDNPVGRIAAIENHSYNEHYGSKVGFFGFFESENDPNVAKALFEKVEAYHREVGYDTLQGPVNPSTNYESGLLIDGFDSAPTVMMTYNPNYYQPLLESNGLTLAMNMFAYRMKKENVLTNEKFIRVKDYALKRSKCSLRLLDKKNIKEEIKNVKKIYNKAWENNWGFIPMSDPELDLMGNELKLIVDPGLVPMIENEKGEVIAFAMALRDINQLLINFKGNLFPFNFLQLLFNKNKINGLRVVLLGILPEYQGKGLDSVMYYEIIKNGIALNIEVAEASWILENNNAMINGIKVVNGEKYKTYGIFEKNI